MDKIICEVCGTSYPGTAAQCPICGYAKPAAPRSAPSVDNNGKYQRVRGGRFSSNNVRKRMESRDTAPVYYVPENVSAPARKEKKPAPKSSNFIFGIVAIILLVALIMMLAWFIVDIVYDRFIQVKVPTVSTTGHQEQDPKISLNFTQLSFERAGDSAVLIAEMDPADTAAVFSFTSADTSVATVDSDGVVNAVGAGNTVITVFSGSIRAEVSVECVFAEPTETTADVKLELNRDDITFSKRGETWDLCGAGVTIAKNKITWTSDDEKIAKITDGIVTAVGGPGVTQVHGEYNGVKVSCTIRCSFTYKVTDSTEATEPEKTPAYTISHSDVTISVDESFNLVLRDADKKAVDVEWKASADGIVSIEGNTITGVKAGTDVIVSTSYEDKTYKCTVRIKDE